MAIHCANLVNSTFALSLSGIYPITAPPIAAAAIPPPSSFTAIGHGHAVPNPTFSLPIIARQVDPNCSPTAMQFEKPHAMGHILNGLCIALGGLLVFSAFPDAGGGLDLPAHWGGNLLQAIIPFLGISSLLSGDDGSGRDTSDEGIRRENGRLLRSFLQPLILREAIDGLAGELEINRGILGNPLFQARVVKAEEVLTILSNAALKVELADSENPTIDVDLMRLAFFHSLNGTLRAFKVYSDSSTRTLRPELLMMSRLVDTFHPGKGGHYIRNWIDGIRESYEDVPYDLREEGRDELKFRFTTNLEAAAEIMSEDSVLEKLVDMTGLKDAFVGIIKEPITHSREGRLARLRAQLRRRTGTSAVTWQKIELILARLRNLNKAYRLMRYIESRIDSDEFPLNLESIEKMIVRILNIEGRSRRRTAKAIELAGIMPAEFLIYIRNIMGKIRGIHTIRTKGMDTSKYRGGIVLSSNDLMDWLMGLAVNGRCLGYTNHWGESHHTIPEMLFSGTTETLLARTSSGEIAASLTLRFMPAIIEGRMEPVIFRQKARVKDEADDAARYLLNDALIRLAALSGATRIVMHSGFIGDQHSLHHNRELFENGFTIAFRGEDGREFVERITLSNRRLVRDCSLKFVEPGISSHSGFHAHDRKRLYSRRETMMDIGADTYTDPDNNDAFEKESHKGYWVVDIMRERVLG